MVRPHGRRPGVRHVAIRSSVCEARLLPLYCGCVARYRPQHSFQALPLCILARNRMYCTDTSLTQLLLTQAPGQWNPATYLDVMYLQRMRTLEDRAAVIDLFQAVFTQEYAIGIHQSIYPACLLTGACPLHRAGTEPPAWLARCLETVPNAYPRYTFTPTQIQIGGAFLPRRQQVCGVSMEAMASEIFEHGLCGTVSVEHFPAQLKCRQPDALISLFSDSQWAGCHWPGCPRHPIKRGGEPRTGAIHGLDGDPRWPHCQRQDLIGQVRQVPSNRTRKNELSLK